jgi:hypothetical protein
MRSSAAYRLGARRLRVQAIDFSVVLLEIVLPRVLAP